MQRPDTSEHGKAEKQNRKRPRLQLGRELKLREQIQVERSTTDVGGDDPKKNERAAKKRIQRQLHRAIFLVGRAEDRDQEILGDDDQLVEKKEEEEIGAQEYAIGAATTSRSQKKNSFARSVTSQENRTALIAAIPVTKTRVKLIPSSAR